MNILLANNFYYLRGGSERVLFEEQALFGQSGHAVSGFSRKHPQNLPCEHSDYFIDLVDLESLSGIAKIKQAFRLINNKRAALKTLGLRGSVIRNIAHPLNSQHCNLSSNIDVLWVGSYLERKQPDVMLDLAEEMPDTDFTMIIAPGRNQDLNRSIESRAKSICNVDYKGFVKYAHIGQYYARAKIVICTSRSEGFPNTEQKRSMMPSDVTWKMLYF